MLRVFTCYSQHDSLLYKISGKASPTFARKKKKETQKTYVTPQLIFTNLEQDI